MKEYSKRAGESLFEATDRLREQIRDTEKVIAESEIKIREIAKGDMVASCSYSRNFWNDAPHTFRGKIT